MAATTFYDLWMGMRLYVPNAPPFLVQRWMRNAFRELADKRIWSWQLLQGQLVWQDARAVDAVVVAFGSPTVTKAGAFTSADLGRQFRVGSYPLYTIIAQTANTLTLDQNYEGSGDGTVDCQILDAYATLPANFEQFVLIIDPTNQRRIPWWGTWETMGLIDPTRQAAESIPRLLCSLKPSSYAATLGQTMYEYYPKPTAHGAFQYFAKALPFSTRDSDPIPGTLQHRLDVLEAHILAQAARWPGTTELKNPYFNLALAREHRLDFDRLWMQLDIRDDDVYQQSWDTIPWQRYSSWSMAFDTNLLQQTDAGLDSYAGFGYW